MSEPVNEPVDPTTPAGADEGQGDDFDPVQEGAPATGPEAPVPPTGSEDDEV